jgi:ribosomal protein L20A (L18A)
MTIRRWLLIGLPLIVIGAIWLYCGMVFETKARDIALMNSFGGVYLLAGLIAAVNKPWSRVVARIAWYPLLLLVPIGTVLGVLALRILRDDPVERQKFREEMRSVSPEEAVRIVRREAASRFGIKDDKFHIPLVGSLRFAPADVIGFIEDLETDYGFRPAPEVSPSTASVNDLIGAFTTQE